MEINQTIKDVSVLNKLIKIQTSSGVLYIGGIDPQWGEALQELNELKGKFCTSISMDGVEGLGFMVNFNHPDDQTSILVLCPSGQAKASASFNGKKAST